MSVRVIQDNDMFFTAAIIETLEESPESLGMDKESLNDLKKKIKNGEHILIVQESEKDFKENYSIILNEQHIGNIILVRDNGIFEIDIFIFKNYRGKKKKYAKDALEQLILMYPNRSWKARVVETNEYFQAICNILETTGFVSIDSGVPNSKGVNVYEFYK